MSYKIRETSDLDVYHCINRGTGKQLIFENERDCEHFFEIMVKYSCKYSIDILAYCLMYNHFHFLLKSDSIDKISQFMRDLSVSYSRYYNVKYDHAGHLFQGRYISKAVNNDKQLLATIRYIHNNPVKAGISAIDKYKWSSYQDYIYESNIGTKAVKTDFVMRYFPDIASFIEFSESDDSNDTNVLKFKSPKELVDGIKIIREEIGYEVPNGLIVKTLQKPYRDKIICRMKDEGLTTKQIELLTGVSKRIIQRA